MGRQLGGSADLKKRIYVADHFLYGKSHAAIAPSVGLSDVRVRGARGWNHRGGSGTGNDARRRQQADHKARAVVRVGPVSARRPRAPPDRGRTAPAARDRAGAGPDRGRQPEGRPSIPQRLAHQRPPTFMAYWLVPRLGLFQQRHPRIDIQLDNKRDRSRALPEHADVAVRPGLADATGFSAHPFMPEALLPVFGAGLPS